jgi:ABC-type polysaccharide/polyol phosphate transport system ATPase subunit
VAIRSIVSAGARRKQPVAGDPERPGSARAAIAVNGVNKTFAIPRHRPSTLKERALHPFRVIPETRFDAARDISVQIEEGESFGIVGRNGSGKSTLLKMLAGIYLPDSGTIEVRGRVSPLIELGVGFNPELAARDNVIVNGSLLGLRRGEIARRFPKILEFAGLEEFEDLRLKNYSSGMLLRLAFSTAIQVDADVLLFDEVLAVGDADFQEKCFAEFRRMKRDGRTMVMVNHGMEEIRRFCDRALLLEHGEVAAIGDPEEVAERYVELSAEGGGALELAASGRSDDGAERAAEVVDAWVENAAGEHTELVDQGDRITLCAEFDFHHTTSDPVLAIEVKGEHGFAVFAVNTQWGEVKTGECRPGERATLRVTIENRFGVGAYSLICGIAETGGLDLIDRRLDLSPFHVEGKYPTGAAADLPYELDLQRGSSPR